MKPTIYNHAGLVFCTLFALRSACRSSNASLNALKQGRKIRGA